MSSPIQSSDSGSDWKDHIPETLVVNMSNHILANGTNGSNGTTSGFAILNSVDADGRGEGGRSREAWQRFNGGREVCGDDGGYRMLESYADLLSLSNGTLSSGLTTNAEDDPRTVNGTVSTSTTTGMDGMTMMGPSTGT